ncbi:D-arabitol-phosphate dehydrogenase [Planctomycetes bacterium K2D]|nr:D-arabitol-phosphate dehydrogenase [Planctomycetes bacterium K2D]
MTRGHDHDGVRASVFVAPGEPLQLQSFPRPRLASGETLVKTTCCTLCGSDLHTYLGDRQGPKPAVLGHETIGTIVAFGPGYAPIDGKGGPLEIGDRVSWSVAASCGECFFCRHDLPQKCELLFKYGHEPCCGMHPLSGGMAEYCHLKRGTAIFRVPETIPDFVASSANCATATVAAAMRSAGGCRGKAVVIQGAGLLGLTAAAMASVQGAKHILVADVDPQRVSVASRFGADAAVDVATGPDQLADALYAATDNRGADIVFEMSGSADAIRQGLPLLRIGGCNVFVGAVKPISTVQLDPEQLVRRMWTLRGVHNYAPIDLADAIDFLAASWDQFPFVEMVGGEFPLERADEAFQHMIATRAVRVAVRPGGQLNSC